MNILLTGGAGYIGSHTLVQLDKAGHSVVVVDNFMNSQPEAIRRVEKIIGKEVPFVEADIRDRAAKDKVFTAHKIDEKKKKRETVRKMAEKVGDEK